MISIKTRLFGVLFLFYYGIKREKIKAFYLMGATKGDVLGYKITLPNDSTKIWIKGMNEYSAKGTGSLQKFTVNAQILPEDSSSKYVAEDIYVYTLTAEVSY